MKLKGIEKQFWWHFGQITDTKNIPQEIAGVSGIDDPDYNDEFFEILTSRVGIIHSIYLKETAITDHGVKLIAKVKQLKSLTLMKHTDVTRASLPYLNQLSDLTYLDIWRTDIVLDDLGSLNQLKNLKELYVSSARKAADDTYPELDSSVILEQVSNIKVLFPQCTFFVDFKEYR